MLFCIGEYDRVYKVEDVSVVLLEFIAVKTFE